MKTIRVLKWLYAIILIVMLWVIYEASIQKSILAVGPEIEASKWFQATLWDTYFAFLAIALWICYRERRLWVGLLWSVMIMLGGNVTIALYVLITLFGVKPHEGIREWILGAKK